MINLEKEAKFFITFDMLGDLKRSGPLQWKIDRFRTEDVKDHVCDLITLTKLIKPYLPKSIDIDTDKMIDYAIIHDLEEVITGDITGFEGVTKDEKERVNKIAMAYLISEYGDVLNSKSLFKEFEDKTTIEAKVLHMLDKVSSSIAFLKYDNENKVDMDNPFIWEGLRNHPEVLKMRAEGLSLGEIFYRYHLRSVQFTDKELEKYNISREDADKIVIVIKSLMKCLHDSLTDVKTIVNDFPEEAMIYRDINERRVG